uniref:Methyltransferase n=1 Tax=Candidatus Endomicrobium sp. MdDo-005 TaxID=1837115 RepID=A0A1C9ZTD7_9BACT|nr:type II modification methylase [Candidatus Endomicrobium sp. MdDo-005]
MEEYKIVELRNSYTDKDISSSLPVLNYAGVETVINSANIIFKFDVVDLKYLKSVKTNPLIVKFVEELYKIHSFSTSNGKVIFKSFNKDRKVRDKNENKEKTLAYKYYRKCFSEENTELNSELVNKVYCADSLVFLRELPDNCIDMILTSPPYNFGISYNNTNDVNMWENYFNILFSIFKECIRVLKSGGRIVVNIQPMFSDYIPTHHFISNFFIKEGLIWKGEIIWEKNNYNCKYCTWGSWRSPSSPYLKYSWEFIEVFCKNHLRKDGDKDNIDIEAEEFKKWVYSKWSIAPERKMKEFKHDAMFPEELVKRAIKLFSYKNDIVLDPFNGVGTTTKVASQLERRFIGIDIDPEYCNAAKKRLEETATLFD